MGKERQEEIWRTAGRRLEEKRQLSWKEGGLSRTSSSAKGILQTL